MTFGIIEGEDLLLAELIALAFESAGHDCFVVEDIDHATRILGAIKVDALVLDIHVSGRSGLDWLETAATIWPDLPSRTLLLAKSELETDEAARIAELGADVDLRPFSLVGVEKLVIGRLQKAWHGMHRRLPRGGEQEPPVELYH